MAEQRIVSVDITYLVTAALAQHPTSDDEESHFAATADDESHLAATADA